MSIARGPRRKVVLATNVAESSVTIDGVTAVVDGSALTGKISVVSAGKYDCGLKAGLLNCKPPIEGAKKGGE